MSPSRVRGTRRKAFSVSPINFTILDARHEQIDTIALLLERLASFPHPARRQPQDLWLGDAELLRRWANGGLPEALVKAAQDTEGRLLGVAFAQHRPEALSHAPAMHLEVLAVVEEAEGSGVGRALLEAVEKAAREEGAEFLTLNVFMSNEKARGFYRHLGYDEEILRCIKEL